MTVGDGDLVLMVKPQFEVGRERVGKGGVVRDPALRAEAVRSVAAAAAAAGLGRAGGDGQPAARVRRATSSSSCGCVGAGRWSTGAAIDAAVSAGPCGGAG